MGRGDKRRLLLPWLALAPLIGGGSTWTFLCAVFGENAAKLLLFIFRVSEDMEDEDEEFRDDNEAEDP